MSSGSKKKQHKTKDKHYCQPTGPSTNTQTEGGNSDIGKKSSSSHSDIGKKSSSNHGPEKNQKTQLNSQAQKEKIENEQEQLNHPHQQQQQSQQQTGVQWFDGNQNVQMRDTDGSGSSHTLLSCIGQILDRLFLSNANSDVLVLGSKSESLGLTRLSMAVSIGHTETVKKLLDDKADINARSTDQSTALHNAVFWRRYQIADILLQRGASVTDVTAEGNNSVMLSSRNDDVLMLHTLWPYRQDIDINAGNEEGNTALHMALLNSSKDCVEFLLKFGARPDTKNKCGLTPLHIAAAKGDLSSCEGLLNCELHSTSPSKDSVSQLILQEDQRGLTSLCEAVKYKHNEVTHLLRSKLGPDVELTYYLNRLKKLNKVDIKALDTETRMLRDHLLLSVITTVSQFHDHRKLLTLDVVPTLVKSIQQHTMSPMLVAIVCTGVAALLTANTENGAKAGKGDGEGDEDDTMTQDSIGAGAGGDKSSIRTNDEFVKQFLECEGPAIILKKILTAVLSDSNRSRDAFVMTKSLLPVMLLASSTAGRLWLQEHSNDLSHLKDMLKRHSRKNIFSADPIPISLTNNISVTQLLEEFIKFVEEIEAKDREQNLAELLQDEERERNKREKKKRKRQKKNKHGKKDMVRIPTELSSEDEATTALDSNSNTWQDNMVMKIANKVVLYSQIAASQCHRKDTPLQLNAIEKQKDMNPSVSLNIQLPEKSQDLFSVVNFDQEETTWRTEPTTPEEFPPIKRDLEEKVTTDSTDGWVKVENKRQNGKTAPKQTQGQTNQKQAQEQSKTGPLRWADVARIGCSAKDTDNRPFTVLLNEAQEIKRTAPSLNKMGEIARLSEISLDELSIKRKSCANWHSCGALDDISIPVVRKIGVDALSVASESESEDDSSDSSEFLSFVPISIPDVIPSLSVRQISSEDVASASSMQKLFSDSSCGDDSEHRLKDKVNAELIVQEPSISSLVSDKVEDRDRNQHSNDAKGQNPWLNLKPLRFPQVCGAFCTSSSKEKTITSYSDKVGAQSDNECLSHNESTWNTPTKKTFSALSLPPVFSRMDEAFKSKQDSNILPDAQCFEKEIESEPQEELAEKNNLEFAKIANSEEVRSQEKPSSWNWSTLTGSYKLKSLSLQGLSTPWNENMSEESLSSIFAKSQPHASRIGNEGGDSCSLATSVVESVLSSNPVNSMNSYAFKSSKLAWQTSCQSSFPSPPPGFKNSKSDNFRQTGTYSLFPETRPQSQSLIGDQRLFVNGKECQKVPIVKNSLVDQNLRSQRIGIVGPILRPEQGLQSRPSPLNMSLSHQHFQHPSFQQQQQQQQQQQAIHHQQQQLQHQLQLQRRQQMALAAARNGTPFTAAQTTASHPIFCTPAPSCLNIGTSWGSNSFLHQEPKATSSNFCDLSSVITEPLHERLQRRQNQKLFQQGRSNIGIQSHNVFHHQNLSSELERRLLDRENTFSNSRHHQTSHVVQNQPNTGSSGFLQNTRHNSQRPGSPPVLYPETLRDSSTSRDFDRGLFPAFHDFNTSDVLSDMFLDPLFFEKIAINQIKQQFLALYARNTLHDAPLCALRGSVFSSDLDYYASLYQVKLKDLLSIGPTEPTVQPYPETNLQSEQLLASQRQDSVFPGLRCPRQHSNSDSMYTDTQRVTSCKRSRRWRDALNKVLEIPWTARRQYGDIILPSNAADYNISQNEWPLLLGYMTDGSEVAVLVLNKTQAHIDPSVVEKLTGTTDNNFLLKCKGLSETLTTEYAAFELCDYNLPEYMQIVQLSHRQDPLSTSRLAWQFLEGLKIVHQIIGIPHGNLKPSWIFVDSEGRLKLGGYGIQCRQGYDLGLDKNCFLRRNCWVNSEDSDNEPVSLASKPGDIQVAGMLIYFMLTGGQHPFVSSPIEIEMTLARGGNILDHINEEAQDLISSMLYADSLMRPNVDQCLKHPYFWSWEKKFRLILIVGSDVLTEMKTGIALTGSGGPTMIEILSVVDMAEVSPNWVQSINSIVMKEMRSFRVYKNNLAELTLFIYNCCLHFDKMSGAAKEILNDPCRYFQDLFPALFMAIFRSIKSSDRKERTSYKPFF